MQQITIPQLYNLLYTKLGPRKWWPAQSTVQLLCGAVLIQNTNWRNVDKALYLIADKTNFGVAALLQLSTAELQDLIRPSGFFRSKERYVRALLTAYRDDFPAWQYLPTPDLRKQLRALPGIGDETADVLLLFIFHRPAFVADTYTRRLFAALGVPSKNYRDLQKQVPFDLPIVQAQELHALLDDYGKLGVDDFHLAANYQLKLN